MSDLDLPVLDLSTWRDAASRHLFVAGLGDALERWGFVAITGHGIPADLLARSYATAADFFAQPDATKRASERPEIGRQRGYTGFGVERAKDAAVADLKEFWQLGRTLPDDHPMAGDHAIPANLHPATPAGFADTMDDLFRALDGFANELLAAIALYLGLQPATLVGPVREGNSVLRVIHYPPIGEDAPEGAVRAAAHEDINLLTVLPASTAPGLELLDKSGTWRALQTPPDVMICDTGDLMQHLTGGRLPSTTHRVVNPPGARTQARFSMPFFCHPRPDWEIRPISGDAAPITAGAYLRQRLIENGVLAPS